MPIKATPTGAALVDTLMAAAFNRPRDPRSAEYQAGVRAGLTLRICGTKIVHQHPAGSAQSDAFYSGIDEARAIWREHKEKSASLGAATTNTQPDGA